MKRERKTEYSPEETKKVFEKYGEITAEERVVIHNIEEFLAEYGGMAGLAGKCDYYFKFLLDFISESSHHDNLFKMYAYEYVVKLMGIVFSALNSMSEFERI